VKVPVQTQSPQSGSAHDANRSPEPSKSRARLRRVLARLTQPRVGIACADLDRSTVRDRKPARAPGSGLLPSPYRRPVVAPRWHTLWVDALVLVVALWCGHAALRCHDAIVHRRTNRLRSRWWLGPTLLEMGLILTTRCLRVAACPSTRGRVPSHGETCRYSRRVVSRHPYRKRRPRASTTSADGSLGSSDVWAPPRNDSAPNAASGGRRLPDPTNWRWLAQRWRLTEWILRPAVDIFWFPP